MVADWIVIYAVVRPGRSGRRARPCRDLSPPALAEGEDHPATGCTCRPQTLSLTITAGVARLSDLRETVVVLTATAAPG